MNPGVQRFQIGAFKCAVISDGTGPLIPEVAKILFANAPEDELVKALRKYGIAGYDIPYRMNLLYVDTGEQRILIDTGFGAGITPDFGKLAENLQTLGIRNEDIDMVVLTHGHPDHIGGNTSQDGQLTFPRASHVMGRAEWEYWTSEAELAKLSEDFVHFARTKLPPITPKLKLVNGQDIIVPGIRVVFAPGHTPGHIALSITSHGEELLHIVDTVLDPIHVEHPEWVAAVDSLPEQTVATRRKILAQAAADKPLVLCYHFPFPGLGRVTSEGDAWTWQSI